MEGHAEALLAEAGDLLNIAENERAFGRRDADGSTTQRNLSKPFARIFACRWNDLAARRQCLRLLSSFGALRGDAVRG